MAVGAKFVNTVTWKEDLASRKKQLDSIKSMKKHIDSIKKININVESRSVTSLNNKLQKAVDKVKKLNDSGITIEVEGVKTKKASNGTGSTKEGGSRPSRGLSDEEKAERWAKKRAVNTEIFLLGERKITKELRDQYEQQLLLSKDNDEFRLTKKRISNEIRDQLTMQQKSLLVSKQQELADGHVRALTAEKVRLQKQAYKEQLAQERSQKKFLRDREHMIDIYLAGQRHITKEKKEEYRVMLRQAKTAQQLQLMQKENRAKIQDQLDIRRKITREMKKQNQFQRRLSGSFWQMATAGASVYTAYEGIASVIRTGMSFESMNKMMLAVSSNSAEAKDNMKFVSDLTKETGTNIEDSSKAFARMLASSKGKITLDESKDLFTNLSKMTVVMGMNRDAANRSFLAVQQMLNKGKVMSEELTQQLGENMPGALQAMARAAQKAGLIPQNAEKSELEKHLLKAMETGKIMAKDVLPLFGKELQKIAENNDAYEIAVDDNIAVRLGQATNYLRDFQKIMYENGVRGSFEFMLDGFIRFMKEGDGIAKFLGGFASGVIAPFTFSIRLVSSAILDLKYYMSQLFDISEEQADFWVRKTGEMVGFGLAIWGVVAAYKKFKGVTKGVAEVSDAIIGDGKGSKTEKVKDTILGRRGHSIGKPMYVYVVNKGMGSSDTSVEKDSKTKTSKKGKILSKTLKGGAALGSAMIGASVVDGILEATIPQYKEYDKQFTEFMTGLWDKVWMGDYARKDASFDKYMQKQAEVFKAKDPEVNVNVNITPDSEGMSNLLKANVDKGNKEMIDRAYTTMYGR